MMLNGRLSAEKGDAKVGSVYYDVDGICNIFDGSEWVKLFAWSGEKSRDRKSRIESFFPLDIRKKDQKNNNFQ